MYVGADGGPLFLRDLRREDAADFGEQLALGDVNGDGYDDLFVGSPNGSTSPTAELLGYFGAASGLPSEPDWVGSWCGAWDDGQPSSCALAVAGDVDGDGFADLVVGYQSYENSAVLMPGSATGPGDALILEPGDPPTGGGSFGWGVSALGDVNGDGYADFGVSDIAWYDDADLTRSGRLYVYLGAAAGVGEFAAALEPNTAASGFGATATGVDLDADGLDEVVVGAPSADRYASGAVFIFAGSPGGTVDTVQQTLVGDGSAEGFGWGVVPAGDVTDDGVQDLVVLAPFAGADTQGRAYLYAGVHGAAPTGDTGSSEDTGNPDSDAPFAKDDAGVARCGCSSPGDFDAGAALWTIAMVLPLARRGRCRPFG